VVEDVRFAADYFLNATIRQPIDMAVLGLERPEMTHLKREALKRNVEMFLRGVRP